MHCTQTNHITGISANQVLLPCPSPKECNVVCGIRVACHQSAAMINALCAVMLSLLIVALSLSLQIFVHMLLNVLAVFASVFAVLVTGTYGIASQLPAYQNFSATIVMDNVTVPNGCIFAVHSPVFNSGVRDTLRPLESAVFDCTQLLESWPFILSLFILNFLGLILSLVALITNICTPCIEDRYSSTVSWDIKN